MHGRGLETGANMGLAAPPLPRSLIPIPSLPLQTDAFILIKRPAAEAFQSCTVFSPEHGILLVLQRISRQASTGVALDLFDETALALESANQGRSWFLREARLITRHPGLGRDYEVLRHASAFTALIARNPGPAESRPAITLLLRETLAAFATGLRPDVVRLKALYRFARDEGYPLRQHWLSSLPSSDRDEAAAILGQPVSAQAASPERTALFLRRLEDYLRAHTEILME